MTKRERDRLRQAIRLFMAGNDSLSYFNDAMDILAELAREPKPRTPRERKARPSPALADALRHLLGEPDHA